jgi:hypothetical protein
LGFQNRPLSSVPRGLGWTSVQGLGNDMSYGSIRSQGTFFTLWL